MNRHPVITFTLLAGLLVVPASMAPTASAASGATTRVSVASGGTQANSDSAGSAVSADGRYVAFDSASNLVAGDTNREYDVFVRDRDTGATTRVSVATGGTQANGQSLAAAISADGRYVAFGSGASNLVAGDTGAPRPTGSASRIAS